MPSRLRPNVAAIFVNGGKFLLVHKRGRKSWQFPQGGVNPGEKEEQALRREMAEELGISHFAVLYKVRHVHEYTWPKKWRLVHPETALDFDGQRQRFFVCAFPPGQKIRLSSELENFKWASKKELFRLVKIPNLRRAFRKILQEFPFAG